MIYQNFSYILEKKALLHPDDIAVKESHSLVSYTYGELHHRSCALCRAFKAAGIKRGDRISCITGNTVEYLIVFMACARLGTLLSPLNHRLAPFEMAKIVDDAKPKAFVFDVDFMSIAKEILDRNTVIELIVCFGNKECAWAQKLEELIQQHSSIVPEIEGDSSDPLLLLYTAGSTGKPKGVPLTQSNLFFNSINWILDVGITKKDYSLTVIPLFHIGGHMLWTLPHLLVGAKVMLQRRFEPESTLRLLEAEKITNTYFIPAMAKMILALPGWRDFDLGSVRFIGAGGESVPERVTNAFAELGIPILNSYGLTETSDGTISMRPEHVNGKPANCIGKPLTMTDTRIIDSKGQDVQPEEEGELLHRGPSVVSSYWNKPEETSKIFHDGWLHTGDLVKKDHDGFIYFLGRMDDMIITGGENVYPAEVEEVILSYHKVADVAVIGLPDEKWGQTIKAVIAPKGDFKINDREIVEYVKTKLSGFKRPRIIEFVESLPKIGSGKLDRVQIKRKYGK